MKQIKLVFYKLEHGKEEEKITLTEALNFAESNGWEKDVALSVLKDPEIGEITEKGIRIWAEEA